MRIVRLLSALVVVSVGAAACSSGGSDGAEGTTDSSDGSTGTTTTIEVEPSTATSPTTSEAADPPDTATAGPVDEAVADRWTAPGGTSPLQLAVGAPEPEFPDGEDGTVEQFSDGSYAVLVRQVDTDDRHVLVDVVELYLDDDAVREALADGDIDDPDELHGNFYVRNASPKMRDVALSPAAAVDGSSDVVGRLVGRLSSAPGIPYVMRIESGAVVSFEVPAIVDPSAPE